MRDVLLFRSKSIDPNPRVEKQAKSLATEGYNIEIYGWDKTCTNSSSEFKDFYNIKRLKFFAPYNSLDILLYMPFWWIYIIIKIIKNKPIIIQAFDLDSLIPATIGAKIVQSKIIYDVCDFYADLLPPNFPSFIKNIIKFVDNYLINVVDGIILANEMQKEQFNHPISNYIVINNTPLDISKKIKNKNKYLYKGKKQEKFTIFYAGLINKYRGLDNLLKAVNGIKDIEVIIAGYGENKEYMELFSNQLNVNFIGKISHLKILEMTIKSDLIFAFYDTQIPNNKYASPNKLFEAMMCETPILMNNGTYASKIIKKEKCGIVVEYNDINKIRTVIKKLKNNDKIVKKLGKNGKKAYDKKYRWDIMEKRLLNLYKSIMKISK